MHGAFSRAHLCTVRNVARQCPYPACRLWSSAGTGRHRSPHQNHTPAPPRQTKSEIDSTRMSSLWSTTTMTLCLGCWVTNIFDSKRLPWSCFSHRSQVVGTHNGLDHSPQYKKLQNYTLSLHRMLGPQDLWRNWNSPITIFITKLTVVPRAWKNTPV